MNPNPLESPCGGSISVFAKSETARSHHNLPRRIDLRPFVIGKIIGSIVCLIDPFTSIELSKVIPKFTLKEISELFNDLLFLHAALGGDERHATLRRACTKIVIFFEKLYVNAGSPLSECGGLDLGIGVWGSS
jgi:hypothetical protein